MRAKQPFWKKWYFWAALFLITIAVTPAVVWKIQNPLGQAAIDLVRSTTVETIVYNPGSGNFMEYLAKLEGDRPGLFPFSWDAEKINNQWYHVKASGDWSRPAMGSDAAYVEVLEFTWDVNVKMGWLKPTNELAWRIAQFMPATAKFKAP